MRSPYGSVIPKSSSAIAREASRNAQGQREMYNSALEHAIRCSAIDRRLQAALTAKCVLSSPFVVGKDFVVRGR